MIVLRLATEQDAAALADLFINTRVTCLPYLPDLHTTEETHHWMRHHVLVKNEVWLAQQKAHEAEQDLCIAGFMALHENWLEHLYVAPEMQGHGIGSLLLKQAKRLRPAGFQFWVFQRNVQARKFYEARGASLVKLTEGQDNEEHEPDALYAWQPQIT